MNTTLTFKQENIKELWVIYDGECPFCRNYTQYIQLNKTIDNIHLINARENKHPIVNEVINKGYDLDEGMVAKIGNTFYHGQECIHVLAMLSSPSTGFNKLNKFVFKSHKRARLLYPILRFGRNITLKLLGKKKINNHQ